MALTNIIAAKELGATFQPLLLAEIAWPDAEALRLSTHNIRGGTRWNGNEYLPRILNQDIAASQALATEGIDVVPTVTLRLADADGAMKGWENSKGFKGASLKLIFVFLDVKTNTFSSDSRVIFTGICDPATAPNEGELQVRAVNRLNMQRQNLPQVRIQKTCPWWFPTTAEEREAGFSNQDSPFYHCGYCPERGCGNGNFTSCGGSWDECLARLGNGSDIEHDAAGHPRAGLVECALSLRPDGPAAATPTANKHPERMPARKQSTAISFQWSTGLLWSIRPS